MNLSLTGSLKNLWKCYENPLLETFFSVLDWGTSFFF